MSTRRNRIHRENKKRGEQDFLNCKAAFVAGITVLIACVNDIIEIGSQISCVINILEAMFVLGLLFVALCTKKLDKVLLTKGVKDFGNCLTIMSVVEFAIARSLILLSESSEVIFGRISGGTFATVLLSLVVAAIVGVAIYLWICGCDKK